MQISDPVKPTTDEKKPPPLRRPGMPAKTDPAPIKKAPGMGDPVTLPVIPANPMPSAQPPAGIPLPSVDPQPKGPAQPQQPPAGAVLPTVVLPPTVIPKANQPPTKAELPATASPDNVIDFINAAALDFKANNMDGFNEKIGQVTSALNSCDPAKREAAKQLLLEHFGKAGDNQLHSYVCGQVARVIDANKANAPDYGAKAKQFTDFMTHLPPELKAHMMAQFNDSHGAGRTGDFRGMEFIRDHITNHLKPVDAHKAWMGFCVNADPGNRLFTQELGRYLVTRQGFKTGGLDPSGDFPAVQDVWSKASDAVKSQVNTAFKQQHGVAVEGAIDNVANAAHNSNRLREEMAKSPQDLENTIKVLQDSGALLPALRLLSENGNANNNLQDMLSNLRSQATGPDNWKKLDPATRKRLGDVACPTFDTPNYKKTFLHPDALAHLSNPATIRLYAKKYDSDWTGSSPYYTRDEFKKAMAACPKPADGTVISTDYPAMDQDMNILEFMSDGSSGELHTRAFNHLALLPKGQNTAANPRFVQFVFDNMKDGFNVGTGSRTGKHLTRENLDALIKHWNEQEDLGKRFGVIDTNAPGHNETVRVIFTDFQAGHRAYENMENYLLLFNPEHKLYK